MANEVTVTTGIIANKLAKISAANSYSISMTGDDIYSATQLIGTSAEQLGFGEISGIPCALYIENLDATNYVDISLVNNGSTPFAKLLAGQSMVLPPGAAAIYAKANTAACRILIAAAEA